MRYKYLFLSFLISFQSIAASKQREFQFIDKAVYFSLEKKVSLYKELKIYVDELSKIYEKDKEFIAIISAKILYAYGKYKEGRKILFAIPRTSNYYQIVNYDLYRLSSFFNDQDSVEKSLGKIFEKPFVRFKNITKKEMEKLAKDYIAILNRDNKKRLIIELEQWLRENFIKYKSENLDFAKRIRYWEKVFEEVDKYEEKYIGFYGLKVEKINEKEIQKVEKRIKKWEANERKHQDLITLLVFMEIARARVSIGQFKVAERLVADYFIKLKTYHNTVFSKNLELSPLFAARYVLGLCYLIKAELTNKNNLIKERNALLLGGSKKYKNGAAQNFYFILKNKVDSYYKWKAFDRFEYTVRPKIKKWMNKKLPSLIISKTYGIKNIARLAKAQLYIRLLDTAEIVLASDKFTLNQKLEVQKDIMIAYLATRKFSLLKNKVIEVESLYTTKKLKDELSETYQYLGKFAYDLKKKNKNNLSLSNDYYDLIYFFFERAYKNNPDHPLISKLIYFLATDQYNIYKKSKDENIKKSSIKKCLGYANKIITEYSSDSDYLKIIFWIAGIYDEIKDEKNSIKYYNLYLSKAPNSDDFKIRKIYSLSRITNLLIISQSFDYEEFLSYADRLNSLLNITISLDEKKFLTEVREYIYIDEKKLYNAKIQKSNIIINELNLQLLNKKISNSDFIKFKNKTIDEKNIRKKFYLRLIKLEENILERGHNKEENPRRIFDLANYYFFINKKQKSQEKYDLLLTKYPDALITKLVFYKDVFNLISEDKLVQAADEFNKIKDKLVGQSDSNIKRIFNSFFVKDKLTEMAEEDYFKLINVALFCAKTRLKLLSPKNSFKESNFLLQMAQCNFRLQNFSEVYRLTDQIILKKDSFYYDAYLLKGLSYKKEFKNEEAITVFVTLFELLNASSSISKNLKNKNFSRRGREEYKRNFTKKIVKLKFSILVAAIELSYELKKYKKALIYIFKFEGLSTKKVENLEKYFEIASAIKILAQKELKPDIDLIKPVKQFAKLYPNSKWTTKLKRAIN